MWKTRMTTIRKCITDGKKLEIINDKMILAVPKLKKLDSVIKPKP